MIESDEDQRADPGGQQARYQHNAEQRSADSRRFIKRNAPTNGDPSSVLMAAKLPAAPMTTLAICGASFFKRWTASTPSPLPMAMRGASGPSTTPSARWRKRR